MAAIGLENEIRPALRLQADQVSKKDQKGSHSAHFVTRVLQSTDKADYGNSARGGSVMPAVANSYPSPARPAFPFLVTKLLIPCSCGKADIHSTAARGQWKGLGLLLGLSWEGALPGVFPRSMGRPGSPSLCQESWDGWG